MKRSCNNIEIFKTSEVKPLFLFIWSKMIRSNNVKPLYGNCYIYSLFIGCWNLDRVFYLHWCNQIWEKKCPRSRKKLLFFELTFLIAIPISFYTFFSRTNAQITELWNRSILCIMLVFVTVLSYQCSS